jgi:hypothetical protein
MMKKNTYDVLGQLLTFIITSCKKIVPKFIQMKKKLGKKHLHSFSKVIMLVHYILFAPNKQWKK